MTPKPKVNWWYVAGILVAVASVLWPLAQPGFIVTDDGDWMVIRLSAFFQSWREGQFPVRFLGRLNHSYGYPVANFLYPGFLYLGSLIHSLGFSFPDTVKIILAGSVMGSAILVFAWLRKYFDQFSSFVGALGFLFSPYLSFDLYKRGSVGEVLALFPAVTSLYSLATKKYWLLAPAVGFLLISHNSLALMFLFLLVFYLLIHGQKWSLVPLIIGIGMATFFWLPALWERRYVIFDATAVSQPAEYFIGVNQLLLLGPGSVLAAWLLWIRRAALPGLPWLFFWVAFVVSSLMATSLTSFLWSEKWLTNLIQFPYRFLSIGVLVGPWLVAGCLKTWAKRQRLKLALLFILLGIIPGASAVMRVETVERPLGFYTTNEATTTVADEYMPRWVKDKPTHRASQKVEFYQGRGTIEPQLVTTQRIETTINALEESVVQVNTIYYPGWGALVDDLPERITYENPQGLMRVHISQGQHRLVVEFRETILRFIADVISLVSIAAGVALVFYSLKKDSIGGEIH